MGILRYFKVLIGREDVFNPKPHPEPILKALKELNAKKEDAWMIGDTVMDMQSAKSANVNALALTCGYGMKKELECFAQNLFANPLEAVRYIAKDISRVSECPHKETVPCFV